MLQVKEGDKIVILLHTDPDLDCIGSALALKETFTLGKCEAVIVGRLTYSYSWLLDKEDILEDIPKEWEEEKYMCVCVDVSNYKRLSKRQQKIVKGSVALDVFDHHICNREEWVEWLGEEIPFREFVDVYSDSCCAHMWRNILTPGARIQLSETAKTALLGGIYAESNCFRDSGTEAFRIVADLIEKGANMQNVARNCNKTIVTWPKLEFLSKMVLNAKTANEGGVVIFEAKYNDYLFHNYNVSRFTKRKAPVYVLSMLRRENITLSKKTNAYILFYDRQDKSNKPLTMVMDLIRWSEERQEALRELGFEIHRKKQYRYYMDIAPTQMVDMGMKIGKALKDTEDKKLEVV